MHSRLLPARGARVGVPALVLVLVTFSFVACGGETSAPASRPPSPPHRADGLGPRDGIVDLSRPARIRARFAFVGDPALPRALDLGRDAWCAENHTVFDERLVVGTAGELAHVLVHLEGLSEWRDALPAPTGAVTLRQVGCRYEPHVIALRRGQDLEIVNGDDTSHNVQILAKLNPETNFTQHRLDEVDRIRFERPELSMPLLCAFHPWMKGWIHVFDHPGFGLSDATGQLAIDGIPPGRYRLHFRHESLSAMPASREIELAPGATLDLGRLEIAR